MEDQYARLGLVTLPHSVPGAVWAVWLNSWFSELIFPAGAVTLLLLLPDGRATFDALKAAAKTGPTPLAGLRDVSGVGDSAYSFSQVLPGYTSGSVLFLKGSSFVIILVSTRHPLSDQALVTLGAAAAGRL